MMICCKNANEAFRFATLEGYQRYSFGSYIWMVQERSVHTISAACEEPFSLAPGQKQSACQEQLGHLRNKH